MKDFIILGSEKADCHIIIITVFGFYNRTVSAFENAASYRTLYGA